MATKAAGLSTSNPSDGDVRNPTTEPDRADIDGEFHLVVKALDGIVALADFLEERLGANVDGRTASAGIAVLAGDANERLRKALDALERADSEREASNG